MEKRAELKAKAKLNEYDEYLAGHLAAGARAGFNRGRCRVAPEDRLRSGGLQRMIILLQPFIDGGRPRYEGIQRTRAADLYLM
jgi:hypothetical protein